MSNDRSSLSAPAERLLVECGVDTPDQLFNAPGSVWLLIRVRLLMLVGQEIVAWAQEHGVRYGPSPEWFALFAAAVDLPFHCRQALWRCSFTANRPEDLASEDVAMEITSSKKDKAAFRTWALHHAAYFGPPTLEGLPEKVRKLLRGEGFCQADDVAKCTRKRIRSIRNLGDPFLQEVERWLQGQGLNFAAENGGTDGKAGVESAPYKTSS
jgi:hypothetical protein